LRRVALSILITMLLIGPSIFIQVEGRTQPLTVILTYPDIEYNLGDEITAQAHIFRQGARFDPDTVRFTAGKDYDRHPMSRTSIGLWEGTVQITREQIYSHNAFPIEVEATAETLEHEWDVDSHLVWVSHIPHLHVNMYLDDAGDQLPSAGDLVDFTVTVSHGNKFVDPDPGDIRAYVTAEEDEFTEDLTVVRRSEGVYGGAFVVPHDVQHDIYFRIWVEVDYTGEIDTENIRAGANIYMKRYSIWVQQVDYGEENVKLEINVVDLEGTPVSNASLMLNMTYGDADDEIVSIISNKTTGPDGITPFEVPTIIVEDSIYGVFIHGEISVNGFSQRWGFWVADPDYTDEFTPNSDGFKINLQNEQPIPAGTNVSLRFNATYDGELLPSTIVDCYLYWDHSVLYYHALMTDDEGEFEIDIDTPDSVHTGWWRDRIHGQFKAETHTGLNMSWRDYEFSYYASYSDYINGRTSDTTLDLVQIGEGAYQFSLRTPGMDGEEEYVRVVWDLGAYNDFTVTYPSWSSGEYHFFYEHPVVAEWSGEAWVGTVTIPSMIPGGTTFNLKAEFTNVDVPHFETITVRIWNSTDYLNNEQPTLDIFEPNSGDTVEGSFRIMGTASDDSAIKLVEVRIDGGSWTAVMGTDEWELEVMADELNEGMHTVEAWSFDGTKRSEIDIVKFNYIRVEHTTDDPVPMLFIIVVLIMIAVVLILVLVARSSK
jgi:hypothetical protein